MAIDLSEHTMVIHKKVSLSEARYLCSLYGKSLSKSVELSGADIKIAGINQINILGIKIPNSGNWIYDVKIQVNVGRLIKQTKVAMLVLNKSNVNAIIKRLNEIFTKTFAFKQKHCDSAEWYMERIDCGIDLKLGTDDEEVLKAYIKALHDSFDSNNYRGVRYSQYKGWDAPEVQYESVTLETAGCKNGNSLYKYNIYCKLLQLTKYAKEHGLTLSQAEIDEIRNVIRIEKQIIDVAKVFGCSNKLGSLLDEDVTEKVMNNIIREIKLFFGVGDYMPYEEGIARIYSSNYDIDAQNFMGVVYAYVDSYGYSALLEFVEQQIKSSGGTDDDVSKKHKEIALARKRIESLGISVASVHDMPMMKGISTLLDDELKTRAKPRKKHKFSEINSVKEPSGGIRYMCKPTIHSEKGEFKRTTIASSVGGSREECEIKVYEKIRSNLNIRYQSFLGQPEKQIKCCEDAVYDYERFRTIVKSKNVRMDIEQMLDKISRRIILKKGECEYV
uniref:hypothetical protein n=1 Tax=Lachnospira sp. TaxID=2049031 RepID=UPI003FF02292